MKLKNTLLLLLSVASSTVIAQSSQSPSDSQVQTQNSSGGDDSSSVSTGQSEMLNLPPAAPMAQLEPKTENGFTYLCGGVGADEAKQLKHAARDYDMMLTFATRKGDYLADVNVDIRDAQGKLELNAACDGPLMLVDFPRSGTYQVHAETGGYALNKTAHVQAKGRSHAALVLSWPQQVATAPEAATSSTGSSGGDNDNNGAR